jgi:hypothetical protein
MDDDTELTFVTPGREPVKSSLGALNELHDRLVALKDEDGEDLDYSDDDALSLARAARMKAGYTFSANHTGKAKLSTDKLGRRVLTVAFSVTSRRKDFPQVASRIMELLADVGEQDEVSVTVTPVTQQLPLM